MRKEMPMPQSVGEVLVWLIVGALAGSVAGMLVTFKKEGLGRWTNLGVGLVGAVVGGLLFNAFKIDLGLGDLKVTGEDLVSAFVGSLVVIGVWALVRKMRAQKSPAKPA
jgi:uncharacterized membrane protein YeaQ/YmgE (transglycosylase-associated protein family)